MSSFHRDIWLSKPKIFTIWPFPENVCKHLHKVTTKKKTTQSSKANREDKMEHNCLIKIKKVGMIEKGNQGWN